MAIKKGGEEFRQIRAAVIDITDRKRAEDALQSSEKKFRNIFENVSDFLYYHDLKGDFIETNFAFKKEYGLDGDTLTYPNLKDMISEQYRAQFDDYLKRIKENGKDEGLLSVRTKNGRELIIEYKNSLVYNSEGIPIGVQGSGRDITARVQSKIEKKKMDQQLQQAQKMEAIGTLAGGIAHDFNNILMGIQGRVSLMLLDTNSNHSNFECLKEIEDYIINASDLAKQLLAFARGGKYEIKPADPNDIIQKSSDMFGRTKKEITIHIKKQKNIWAVEVDQSQIEQIMLNLYVNAWQSMPGGGELYLETENVIIKDGDIKSYKIEPGKYVKISVTDTGIGMDITTQARIFEPFFTTKGMGRGTGLGLASAYGVVKNHGGIIDVFSEKGQGSTFNIYLPASDKVVTKEHTPKSDLIFGSGTILLVDDEKIIIDVGSQILERLGYSVFTASSGKEAVEIFKNKWEEIDLVILDIIMPGMGGGEVFDQLKTIDSNAKVLLSSGYSINGEASIILNKGCNGFIQKPFNIKKLSEVLSSILD
ncbi:response regulator [Thermodesulfobacteriota bacterium]